MNMDAESDNDEQMDVDDLEYGADDLRADMLAFIAKHRGVATDMLRQHLQLSFQLLEPFQEMGGDVYGLPDEWLADFDVAYCDVAYPSRWSAYNFTQANVEGVFLRYIDDGAPEQQRYRVTNTGLFTCDVELLDD